MKTQTTEWIQRYIKPGDRVLEIGPGKFTQKLAQIGAKIVVVDISSSQLELSRQCARKLGFENSVIDWLQHDITNMNTFLDGTFDAIICHGDPLRNVPDRTAVTQELNRVLKTDGIALLGETAQKTSERTKCAKYNTPPNKQSKTHNMTCV
jgi:ubiquinone/menaquinone biosynthesis C-methylase UbiE